MLSNQRSLERHFQSVHVPWFAKDFICEYCERGYESILALAEHLDKPGHRDRVKMIAEQGRRVKRWSEMRAEYAKRHNYVPNVPVTAMNCDASKLPKAKGGQNATPTNRPVLEGPSTPLLDENQRSGTTSLNTDEDFAQILEIASQIAEQPQAPATAPMMSAPSLKAPEAGESQGPSPKRRRTSSVRETLASKSMAEQNKFLAEVLDEQAKKLSTLTRTLTNINTAIDKISRDVDSLNCNTEENLLKTRGYLRDLREFMTGGFDEISKKLDSVSNSGRAQNKCQESKLLFEVVHERHVRNFHTSSVFSCEECRKIWKNLEEGVKESFAFRGRENS